MGYNGIKKTNSLQKESSLIDALIWCLISILTAIIVFIATKNSLMGNLKQFWGTSADFWQNQWDKIYEAYGDQPSILILWGTVLVTNVVFWGECALFSAIDLTNRPKFITRYKVQEEKNVPMDMKKFWHAVRWVLFNSTIGAIIFQSLVMPFNLWRGAPRIDKDLPSYQKVIFDLAFCAVLEEVLFYYSHRLLHHPRIYKYIHKKHHEWTAPISLITLYAHPVENIVSNLFPVGFGPFLVGAHITTTWMWYALAVTASVITHSGYHLPLLPSSEFHDYHHLKFNNNFGVFGWLDRLHGTDTIFRTSKQYQRNKPLLGLEPLSRSIPDNDYDKDQ